MGRRALVLCRAAACLVVAAPLATARAQEDGGAVPAPEQPRKREAAEEIVVIGRLPRLPLPPSRVPASVQVIEEEEPQQSGHPNLPDSLAGRVPGMTLSDEQGNSYQPDLSLRGFQATSVTGVPQGVSVFLDGVRVNEPTAEEINFDLLPTEDVERIEVVPGPSVLFGRNTLAGAIILVTRRGKEGIAGVADVAAGSAGFEKIRARLSGGSGPIDFYASGVQTVEDGWREASHARLSKAFGKVGFEHGGTDLTLSYQYVNNRISQAGPLPVSELVQDRTANYTAGDFFAPRLNQLVLNARQTLADRVVLSANAFGRLLHVEQFNVNLLTENSRLFSRTASGGGTVQVDSTAPLFGRWNLFTAGLEYGHSDVEVQVFNEPDLDTDVHDGQDTGAAYLQDTFQLARGALRSGDELILTAAVRWDWIRHRIADESPSRPGRESASGVDVFRRLDPMIGLNYNLSREHGVYLSFSQGFRAPAFLELTCAGPAAICPGLQAGTAPDPPLKPVRVTNYELGVRTRPVSWFSGQVSAYRTDVLDDIFVATPRPTSDCSGQSCTERVRAGSQFPLVPRNRGSAELDFHPYGWLSLSLSGTWVGSQYLRGDEQNVGPRLDGYFSLEGGLRVSLGGFVAWARFTNLLDARYSTFGTFARNAKRPGAPVEPFLTPARPFQFFAGVGYTFGSRTESIQ